MWWLILCVSVTGPQGAQRSGPNKSDCVCDAGVSDELTFELVDCIRLPSLMWVALIQSVEGMNWTKRADPPLNKSWLTDLRYWASLVLGLKLKHQLFWGFKFLGFVSSNWYIWFSWLPGLQCWTGTLYSSPGSPACPQNISGFLSLQKHESQYLMMTL